MTTPADVVRRIRHTWRCGRAFWWLILNNADLVRAGRTRDGVTAFGWEVCYRGARYYSADALMAVQYAQEGRPNPYYAGYRRVECR